MSRATMAATAAKLPKPAIFGIGTYRVGDTVHDFEISWDDFERDTQWAETTLRNSGVTADDLILITSPNCEGPWTSPIVNAILRIGATYATAEQFSWDARRVAMFLKRLPVTVMIGLGAETLTALEDSGVDIPELFSGVRTIWARADCIKRLPAVAPEVLPFVPLGPALALGLSGTPGARVNTDEWELSTVEGLVTVTTASDRLTQWAKAETGVHGEPLVVDDKVSGILLT